jgi:hypothetical protein
MGTSREVYVVLRQIDESMPPDVIGVYETAKSADAAATEKGCWVVISTIRV